jgi:hypothetical protein
MIVQGLLETDQQLMHPIVSEMCLGGESIVKFPTSPIVSDLSNHHSCL